LKTIPSRAEQKVGDVIKELIAQTPAQLLADDRDPNNWVLKVCGLLEYFHKDQTLGNIVYIRNALRNRKQILLTLVHIESIKDDYQSLNAKDPVSSIIQFHFIFFSRKD
jgi:uncharacterized iron-regulated protein